MPGTLKAFILAIGLALCALALPGCSKQSVLEKIEQEGVLHVVTRNQPPSYYEDRDGPAGFEYDLAKMLADELGVELRLRFVESPEETRKIIQNGFAHFAMAGFGVTNEEQEHFDFGPAYLNVHPTVLYRKGTLRPRKTADLSGKNIHVVAHTHAEQICLRLSREEVTDMTCVSHDDKDPSELMGLIEDEQIGYALIDSNDLTIYQALFPHAKAAFPLDDNIQIAWLLQKSEDKSLSGFIGAFFQRLKNEGSLERMRNLYYGHVQKMNYVGARTFIQHIETRLPQFQDTFQKAAEELGLDWRLLAAIAYQESHWNESAVSPTGVRGLMMLTQATAEEMGVKDRLNPAESILGGARYFSKIHARMPERISEPDRTWLTLAAYNVGYGHLEDARVLTQNGGKNPDAWSDVREHLPLLAKKKWHAQSKHGFARGEEPVNYVRNVRRYYDVLVWMGGAQEGKPPKNQLAEEESTPKLKLDAKLPISEMPPTL